MDLFKPLLIIHIIGGSLSLVLGTVVLMIKKGTARHKLLGRIFYYAMLIAAIVSMPMSYLHPNYFLFIIGVFTSFMLLSGRRYMVNKGKPEWQDWLLTSLMLVLAMAFIGFGGYHMIRGDSFGLVFLVFGSVSLLFVYHDWTNFTGRSKISNYYLTTHLQRMLGSYIASVTAFLVVNNTILPPMIAWLLPTAAVTPLIVTWSRKHKKIAIQEAVY
jgi:uncharacterized membrane protein